MSDQLLRTELANFLNVRQAHMHFEDAIRDFPVAHINTRPPNVPYTFWHLLEHLRIAQWDILDYIRNPQYQHREWPREYWPDPQAVTDEAGWQHTLALFRADLAELTRIVRDPNIDLQRPIPHGYDGHTILREIEVVGAHNAYHVGEFAILRQVMGLW